MKLVRLDEYPLQNSHTAHLGIQNDNEIAAMLPLRSVQRLDSDAEFDTQPLHFGL